MQENIEVSKATELLNSIENQQDTIFLPFEVFFANPSERLTLNIKNNAPLTNPPIRITNVICEFNYVQFDGSPKKTVTIQSTPNVPPSVTAVVQADVGECVRTLSFQVTVGIPELNQFVQLEKVNVPDYNGCFLSVKAGVGTGSQNLLEIEKEELQKRLFGDSFTNEPQSLSTCTVTVYNNLPPTWNSYIFGVCGFIFDDNTDETDSSNKDAQIRSGGALVFKTQSSKCVVKYIVRLFVQLPGEARPRGPIDTSSEPISPGQCIGSGEFKLEPQRNISSIDLQSAYSSAFFRLVEVL